MLKKIINSFTTRSPADVRADYLLAAELALLDQQQLRDYHDAMCQMLEKRIASLQQSRAAELFGTRADA